MTTNAFLQIWQRMLDAINAQTDAALAQFLAITPAGVSSVKKKQKIPASWFDKICQETGISREWLIGSAEEAEQVRSRQVKPDKAKNLGMTRTRQPTQPGHFPSSPPQGQPGKEAYGSKPPCKRGSANLAATISQAIDLLESKSEYADALAHIIHTLHRAMLTEQQIAAFSTEMMDAFAAFQKQHKQS